METGIVIIVIGLTILIIVYKAGYNNGITDGKKAAEQTINVLERIVQKRDGSLYPEEYYK